MATDVTKEFLVGNRLFDFKHLPSEARHRFLVEAMPLFCSILLRTAGKPAEIPEAYEQVLAELVAQMTGGQITPEWVLQATDSEARQGLVVRQIGFEMATDDALLLLRRLTTAIDAGLQA